MTKIYTWVNPTETEIPIGDRTIKESEEIVETVEKIYTLSQRHEEIEKVKAKIVELQELLPVLESELLDIETALSIEK